MLEDTGIYGDESRPGTGFLRVLRTWKLQSFHVVKIASETSAICRLIISDVFSQLARFM